jgi:hypothetical protein
MPKILKDQHGNLLPYVYQEFPMDIELPNGEWIAVKNKAELDAVKANPPTAAQDKEISEEIQAQQLAAGKRAAQNPSAGPVTSVEQIPQPKFSKRPHA